MLAFASIFFLYLYCLCVVVAELAVPFLKLILHIFNVRESVVEEELLFFPELPMICSSALFAELLIGLLVVQAVDVVIREEINNLQQRTALWTLV